MPQAHLQFTQANAKAKIAKELAGFIHLKKNTTKIPSRTQEAQHITSAITNAG